MLPSLLRQKKIVFLSLFEFTIKLTFMFWTKNANFFLIYLDKLLFLFKKKDQLTIITWLSSFNEQDFLQHLIQLNIIGFYIKFSGKLGGFAGSRSKYFIIKFGKHSRSNRSYKNNFFQKQLINYNGTVGVNISITYI